MKRESQNAFRWNIDNNVREEKILVEDTIEKNYPKIKEQELVKRGKKSLKRGTYCSAWEEKQRDKEIRHTDSFLHLRAWVITLMCVQSRLFGQQVSSSLWHLSVCVRSSPAYCVVGASFMLSCWFLLCIHNFLHVHNHTYTHAKERDARDGERRDLMSWLPPDIASAMLINPAGKIHHQDSNPYHH